MNRSFPWTTVLLESIKTAYLSGMSPARISKKYGPAESVIRWKLVDMGVKLRDPSEAARIRKKAKQPVKRNPDRAMRECLRCERKFMSEGPAHRICKQRGCTEKALTDIGVSYGKESGNGKGEI